MTASAKLRKLRDEVAESARHDGLGRLELATRLAEIIRDIESERYDLRQELVALREKYEDLQREHEFCGWDPEDI